MNDLTKFNDWMSTWGQLC